MSVTTQPAAACAAPRKKPASVRFREHMRRNRLAYILLLPAILVIAIVVIYPFFYAFNLEKSHAFDGESEEAIY